MEMSFIAPRCAFSVGRGISVAQKLRVMGAMLTINGAFKLSFDYLSFCMLKYRRRRWEDVM